MTNSSKNVIIIIFLKKCDICHIFLEKKIVTFIAFLKNCDIYSIFEKKCNLYNKV